MEDQQIGRLLERPRRGGRDVGRNLALAGLIHWHTGDYAKAIDHSGGVIDSARQIDGASEIIEGVRNQLREERFQAGYIQDKFQVYVALVRLLLKMGKTGQAFVYSEKLRAQSYLDLLNHSQFSAADPREAEVRARIRRLQQALEEENRKPSSAAERGKAETFSSRLSEAEREYQAMIDDRRNSGPAGAAQRARRGLRNARSRGKGPPLGCARGRNNWRPTFAAVGSSIHERASPDQLRRGRGSVPLLSSPGLRAKGHSDTRRDRCESQYLHDMGNRTFWVFLSVVLLVGLAAGYRLSALPRLETYKLLNVAGLSYSFFGVLVLSELVAASASWKNVCVKFLAPAVLWFHAHSVRRLCGRSCASTANA